MNCATNNSNKTQGRTITFPFHTEFVKTVIVSPFSFTSRGGKSSWWWRDSVHEFHIPVYVPNPVCEQFVNLDRLIFMLHHSLLSRRQSCWILTSEQKGECCRLAFSFTSGSIGCGRISHPPFTFHIQYTKTVCESGQILMHLSMICPRMGSGGGGGGVVNLREFDILNVSRVESLTRPQS